MLYEIAGNFEKVLAFYFILFQFLIIFYDRDNFSKTKPQIFDTFHISYLKIVSHQQMCGNCTHFKALTEKKLSS